MIKGITIGADPELFLEKNGKIISAEGLIGGTKESPKPISDDGHFIQEDNVMIEFNIPPSSTLIDFKDNINYVKDYLEALAKIQGGKLNFAASADIDPKYLKTEQALLFGCDPDMNVYLKAYNTPPIAGGTLRTCGGHIHIGYDNPTQDVSQQIIYAMDFILGLQSITLDRDDRRRQMYGNAGCFRFKSFGVEYRTLSNFWIQSDELIEWTYTKTMEAINLVNSGLLPTIIEKYSFIVKDIIDTNNKEGAVALTTEIAEIINKQVIIKKSK